LGGGDEFEVEFLILPAYFRFALFGYCSSSTFFRWSNLIFSSFDVVVSTLIARSLKQSSRSLHLDGQGWISAQLVVGKLCPMSISHKAHYGFMGQDLRLKKNNPG
jgi:hypothetical protein